MKRHRIPSLVLSGLVLAGCAGSAPATLQRVSSPAEGFDTHSWFYDFGDEVVVFDAQFTPALAESVIADIRRSTKSPITTLVVTHPNPDKFNGVSAFQAIGARVVASRATADALPGVHAYKRHFFVDVAGMFTAETYPAEARIDRIFSGELRLAGGRLVLRELRHAGVSSTQTVAIIPEADAVVVGDLVHHGVHAWLEGGIVEGRARPDLAAWHAALDELTTLGVGTVYGGRGEAAPVAAAVKAQQDYLTRAEALVRAELAERGEAPFDPVALTARFSAAFPDRGLAYLVQYGAYGLVDALR